ncbi:MAG: hypothetical protein CM15mP98_10190 [Paracoccaceae bacterium]|nr:MAG: hypothetical protein CM15mP98_10190 [Paracoccaceae bacterium]
MPVGHRHKKKELISLYNDAGAPQLYLIKKNRGKNNLFAKMRTKIFFITTKAETQTDCLKFNEYLKKALEKKSL